MAVANHNALPMYQVNSDLFYEQVFIFLPLFQFSPHLYSAKPVCPRWHKGVSLQIQHLSGETVQSSKSFISFFLRLKSRMLTSPSLTLISIWTLRSRVFWSIWIVPIIYLYVVLQMPDFVKIFPNYSTAKTAPAGEWMKWTVHCQHFSTLKTDKQLQESLLIANHLNFSRKKDSGIAIQIYKELLFRFLQYSCHKD